MLMDTLSAIAALAGVLGVASGAGLLLVPERMLHEGTRLRRWVLDVDLGVVLDRRRTIERPLYRHHRAFGTVVILAGSVWFVTLWGLRDYPLVIDMLAASLGVWGLRALTAVGWISALFTLGIGVWLVIRPSGLKGLEAAANRWIEPFAPIGQLGTSASYDFIGRLVLRFPRLAGLLLLAAGFRCLDLF